MRKQLVCGIVLTLSIAAFVAFSGQKHVEAVEEKGPMLAHDVYFSLSENSDDARNKLVDACKKYLSKHDGEVFFAAGTRAQEFQREVNDHEFDVALHIYFKDKAAHDKYQQSKRHLQFIDENKDQWKKVRVFDSVVRP